MNELLILYVAIGVLISLSIISIIIQKNKKLFTKVRLLLFILITIVIIITTSLFIIYTIMVNYNAITKGPVHWHADFEVFRCNERLELIDPKSKILNKVGTSLFHEHNDNRIHIEGTVSKENEISLSAFLSVVGGKMSNEELSFPTNQGIINMKNGDECNNQKAELQVFLYKIKDNSVILEKIINPKDYIISPYANIPPGDCLIIEFDVLKNKTDKICKTLEISIQKGKVNNGG